MRYYPNDQERYRAAVGRHNLRRATDAFLVQYHDKIKVCDCSVDDLVDYLSLVEK